MRIHSFPQPRLVFGSALSKPVVPDAMLDGENVVFPPKLGLIGELIANQIGFWRRVANLGIVLGRHLIPTLLR